MISINEIYEMLKNAIIEEYKVKDSCVADDKEKNQKEMQLIKLKEKIMLLETVLELR